MVVPPDAVARRQPARRRALLGLDPVDVVEPVDGAAAAAPAADALDLLHEPAVARLDVELAPAAGASPSRRRGSSSAWSCPSRPPRSRARPSSALGASGGRAPPEPRLAAAVRTSVQIRSDERAPLTGDHPDREGEKSRSARRWSASPRTCSVPCAESGYRSRRQPVSLRGTSPRAYGAPGNGRTAAAVVVVAAHGHAQRRAQRDRRSLRADLERPLACARAVLQAPEPQQPHARAQPPIAERARRVGGAGRPGAMADLVDPAARAAAAVAV